MAVVYKYISDLIIVDCKTDQSLCISSSTRWFFLIVLCCNILYTCSVPLHWLGLLEAAAEPLQSVFIFGDHGRVFLASSVMLFLSLAFFVSSVSPEDGHTLGLRLSDA